MYVHISSIFNMSCSAERSGRHDEEGRVQEDTVKKGEFNEEFLNMFFESSDVQW